MIKTIVWDNVERYSTENFSHSFEVLPLRSWEDSSVYKFKCHAIWNGREICSGIGKTRIEAIQFALVKLQRTAFRLPFAEYRMYDILTGQL